MATEIWLDEIGIIHMGPRETAPENDAKGSTMLMSGEILKLAEILLWLDERNITNMAFWEWKHMKGEDPDTGPFEYWRLCPRITFFRDEDAILFKLTYGMGGSR